MKYYLIDDDKHVVNILKLIIKDRNLGEICGSASNGLDALDDLPSLSPDIIMVDLLMPEMDGITFVQRAKEIVPNTAFIMLSQVSSKEMISSAYEAGIEFYIQKPINSIEVENVIQKVSQSLQMQRTMQQMQSIFLDQMPSASPQSVSSPDRTEDNTSSVLKVILQRLGIIGETGSRDIITIVNHLVQNQENIEEITLNELCGQFSDSPKSMEQRIRRTAAAGLVNLAHLGIEDYGNEVFIEYSNSLYNFEQVRREMDYIRGKSDRHGNVKIRNFLASLVAYVTDN